MISHGLSNKTSLKGYPESPVRQVGVTFLFTETVKKMRNEPLIEYGIAVDPVSRVISFSLVSSIFRKSLKYVYKTEVIEPPNDKTISLV